MRIDEAAELLGVAVSASPAELRAAWRRTSQRAHPDHGGTAESFQRAQEAYSALREAAPAGVLWPATEVLPEGSRLIDTEGQAGLVWPALVVTPDSAEIGWWYSRARGHWWETVAIDRRSDALPDDAPWTQSPVSRPFNEAIDAACAVRDARWQIAFPLPTPELPASVWAWRQFCRITDGNGVVIERETASSIAQALESIGADERSGAITRSTAINMAGRFIAAVLTRLNATSDHMPGGDDSDELDADCSSDSLEM